MPHNNLDFQEPKDPRSPSLYWDLTDSDYKWLYIEKNKAKKTVADRKKEIIYFLLFKVEWRLRDTSRQVTRSRLGWMEE